MTNPQQRICMHVLETLDLVTLPKRIQLLKDLTTICHDESFATLFEGEVKRLELIQKDTRQLCLQLAERRA